MATTTQPPATQFLTAEELLQMPNDGNRHELVRGELRTMPLHDFRHGVIAANTCALLGQYVHSVGLGVVVCNSGFLLARKPDTVLAGNVAFVSAQRLTDGEPTGYWEGAPDLAIEVVSPNDTVYEVEEKVGEWLTFGCRMVVVVSDKKHTVTVYCPGESPRILQGQEVFDGQDVVPGFLLTLPEIFA